MAKKTNPVQIQVAVTLNPEAYEFLQKHSPDGDLSGKLAGWCAFFMEQQARGGLMLSSEDHDYVAGLAGGKRFKDSRSLVHAVEKGLNRQDSQHSFVINVDPAHYPALKENAESSGLTVEESLDGVVQMVMASGWLWDFTPSLGRSIPFTRQMLDGCAALCEKHGVDSSDISGLIAEDRLLPVERETKNKIQTLADKKEPGVADLAALLSELEGLRAEVTEFRKAPRELVTA